MKTLLLLAALYAVCPPPPQDPDASILALSGAYSLEDLTQSELERYESLLKHPLRINSAPVSALLSSGLLSFYQVASLVDYRSRSGDVLSLSELGLVDGIGADYASLISPFIDLCPSGSNASNTGLDGSVRAGINWKVSPEYLASLKAGLKMKFGLELFGACKYGNAPLNFSFGAGYEKNRLKLLLGDYRLRLGQGLVAWSGFSLSGVSAPSSVNRNPSYLSLAHSYSSYMRGAAVSYSFGRSETGLSCRIGGDGLQGVAYFYRLYPKGQWAVKAYADRARLIPGLDGKIQCGDVCVFGESAICIKGGMLNPAAVLGADWAPRYGRRVAIAFRCYSPGYDAPLAGALRSSSKSADELGASLSATFGKFGLSADLSRELSSLKSIGKASAVYACTFSPVPGLEFEPSFKATFRYRPEDSFKSRVDLRGDLSLGAGPFRASFRFEGVKCREFAWLWYLESGVDLACRLSVCARFTLFRIDNWDDRIYVYEKDAPGNFSSVAYSGRGLGASLYLKYRSAYLKFRLLRYPWSQNGKSPQTGLALQYEF